ncbi:hypothetical protein JHK84_056132 [Glycine max]|nr:hypothetical protein JHK86_056085 [Glycine max]KAG5074901.1 hypothetical protein JHK84_056132 [Glycine max]
MPSMPMIYFFKIIFYILYYCLLIRVDRENNSLDWVALMKIALGASHGLAYLLEYSGFLFHVKD